MSQVGIAGNPLRVAIIGAGPTGFYAAEHLFKHTDLVVEVDLYDRLPTPFGLVRAGVAPDHQKIKSVTKLFDRVAQRSGFRFFGNVEIGKDISVAELQDYYHQIIFTTGAQTDRYLNIPGADLKNHHPATDFVAWYNGHPDFRNYEFDLTQERVAVIGVGNVAIDVARILARTTEELAATDIADHALEALAKSNVKEIIVIGRRGPAQAAFTTPEIKEMGKLADCDIYVLPEEGKLDALSEKALADSSDRGTARKVEIIQSYAGKEPTGKSRKMTFRFLVSPTEMFGNEAGEVTSMQMVKNELYATDAGTLRPRATDNYETIDVGLVFRSIGYRGVPLEGVPFNDNWGVILNDKGRVIDGATKQPVLGEYTAGWIKRGPSGVIGTNKPDALETVEQMITDWRNGRILNPSHPDAADITAFLDSHKPDYFTYADWQKLDAIEVAKGEAQGRPRVKFTTVDEMLQAVGKETAVPA